MQKNLSS